MFCGRCGKNNADNLKFCTGCGSALGVQPSNQAVQQPYNNQPYGSQPSSNQQYSRQPQSAQNRQAQQQHIKTGFAGLPISRGAFFGIIGGIVGGIIALIVIIVLIVTLTGGGLSGTYINHEFGQAIRFSGRNFTIYQQEWGSDRFHEVEGGTFTIDGDVIIFNFGYGDIERVRYDSSRNEIRFDGELWVSIQRSEERRLEFINGGRIGEGRHATPPAPPPAPAPAPAEPAPAPPPAPEAPDPEPEIPDGGGLSGTYLRENFGVAIRFSDGNFTFYHKTGWRPTGEYVFTEFSRGPYTFENDVLELDFVLTETVWRGLYDSSRGEIEMADRGIYRRLEHSEEENFVFVSER